MTTRILSILCCCLTLFPMELFGQKSCGTVDYQNHLKHQSATESDEVFENWMSNKLRQMKVNPSVVARTAYLNQVLTIPVVVHIVHNGEAIGTGSNLAESRITEQIERLNKDFRRLNADTINTPPEYLGVAADTEIEFVLAQRDPYGLPTNGINRVRGTRAVYNLVNNTELKALIYWPAEKYMNLWVAELESLLGYAQFPVSTLGGLESTSENRLTDGVVIDSDFFGINAGLTPESIGRTCTHEVGHFFGLRHTWGDGGCGVDDFCDDTPLSNSSNFGCPDANSCGSDDMVQNYMDLSDDLCMNLFTLCQKDRMRVVMDNSPRRASLIDSKGATPPVMVDNDAGIREITAPEGSSCEPMVFPTVTVQNTGTNTISSVRISLSVNGNTVENRLVNQTLEPLEMTAITFGEIMVTDMMKLVMTILETNGTEDANQENNEQGITISSESFASLPINETFSAIPPSWEVRNPDNKITWQIATAPSESPGNTAVRLNYFNYKDFNGEYDYLITPALDLSGYTGLSVQFDLSYAPFSIGDQDGLIVAVSTDCGNQFKVSDYVYQKQGMTLATAPVSASSFVPADRSQWRTETLDLDAFSGINGVRIAFIGVNDYGNNLYLDNIQISGVSKPDIDLEVTSILSPVAVTCSNSIGPEAVVRNTGLLPVNNFELSYSLQSGGGELLQYTGPSLEPGEEVVLTFPVTEVVLGPDRILFSLNQVEGQPGDGLPGNNQLEYPFVIDQQEDIIPKIERFETPITSTDWRYVSVDESITWSVTETGGSGNDTNHAAFMNFYSYDQVGAIDYLVTPVLDLSEATKPTMTFDLAYAGSSNYNDGLLILGSKSCGISYSDTLFAAYGTALSTTVSNAEFYPQDTSDWELHTIDLSEYAGNSAVRLAFVGLNDFGNNLFIDNVQFFLTDKTNSLELDEGQMIVFPNPAQTNFNLGFKLKERSSLDLQIIDPTGRVVWNRQLPDVLNQTFEVQLPFSGGIYIVQATGTSFRATRRIIMVQ